MSSLIGRHRRLAGWAVLLAALLVAPGRGAAEAREPGGSGGEAPAKGHFIIRLRPAHAQEKLQEQDKAKIVGHYQYLQKLQAEGKLVLAGLSTDDYQEIVVLRAGSRLEAEAIMAADPAVGGNVYLAELHPFQVAFSGGGK